MPAFSLKLDPITALKKDLSLWASVNLLLRDENDAVAYRSQTLEDIFSSSGKAFCTHNAIHIHFKLLLDPCHRLALGHCRGLIHQFATFIYKAKFWEQLPVTLFLELNGHDSHQWPESLDTDFTIKIVPLHHLALPLGISTIHLEEITLRVAFSKRRSLKVHRPAQSNAYNDFFQIIPLAPDESEDMMSVTSDGIYDGEVDVKAPLTSSMNEPDSLNFSGVTASSFVNSSDQFDIQTACLLMDVVLRTLVGGWQRRRMAEVTIKKSPDKEQTLANINPTIWNPGYIERMVTRRKYTSDIVKSVVNITTNDIQSPSLQQKLAKLQSSAPFKDHHKVPELVESHLFRMMHSTAYQSKFSRSLPISKCVNDNSSHPPVDVFLDGDDDSLLGVSEDEYVSEDVESILAWSSSDVDDYRDDILEYGQDEKGHSDDNSDEFMIYNNEEVDADDAGVERMLLSDDIVPNIDDLLSTDGSDSLETDLVPNEMLI